MKVVSGPPTGMTPMSELRGTDRRPGTAKLASRHAGSPLARRLHGVGKVVRLARLVVPIALSLGAGCIIPPSLSVDVQDAGVDSPPSITSVRSDNQELPEPGPALFEVGGMATLNLTLLDTDVDDTLYVRIFVDYLVTAPTAPRSTCTGTSGASAERTATCDLKALCLPTDVGQTRLMRIVVFDREVLDSGPGPAFMTMAPGGESTSRTYQLKCTS
jgi:hypothetical protein